MKRVYAVLLALAMLAALSACSGLEDLKIEPLPSSTSAPVQTPAGPLKNTEAETGEPTPDEEPSFVIVNIRDNTEIFTAPDDSEQRILTFGYESATVQIPDQPEAAAAINRALGVRDELYYTGTGNGDGLNGLLEQATDNYTVAVETGEDRGLEYSSVRTASVPRADSGVLSLLYLTHVYTGGVHGVYYERGYVFDTATGDRLTLETLSGDYEAFSSFLLDRMVKEARKNEGVMAYNQYDELEEVLAELLRDGSWYFDGEGLVIFSDLYEIASYAEGIVSFRFSYEELAPFVDARWLPVERSGEGTLSLTGQDELLADSLRILDKVVIREGGEELFVTVSGTVYDLALVSVSYIDEMGFYQTGSHWYCSEMSDCAVQLQTVVPEGMPDLMLRYTDASGETHSLLVSQSGLDGSYLLIETDAVEAVG